MRTLAALLRAPDEVIALFLPEEHRRFHSFDDLRATQPDHVFVDHTDVPALLGLPALAVI